MTLSLVIRGTYARLVNAHERWSQVEASDVAAGGSTGQPVRARDQ